MKTIGSLLSVLLLTGTVIADDGVSKTAAERFTPADVTEVPDFQRHVVPLLGKLGCNGRACHGSFQGRGDFRLSLFGYDFKADHGELYGRVDPETPAESLVLQKPLMEVPHEGGQRLKPGSWQHQLLLNWVKADAPGRAPAQSSPPAPHSRAMPPPASAQPASPPAYVSIVCENDRDGPQRKLASCVPAGETRWTQ